MPRRLVRTALRVATEDSIDDATDDASGDCKEVAVEAGRAAVISVEVDTSEGVVTVDCRVEVVPRARERDLAGIFHVGL